MIVQAVCDALQLFLIYGLSILGQSISRPARRKNSQFRLVLWVISRAHDAVKIRNFRSHQIAMLHADVVWGALEMYIGPAAALEAIPLAQGYVVGAVGPSDGNQQRAPRGGNN